MIYTFRSPCEIIYRNNCQPINTHTRCSNNLVINNVVLVTVVLNENCGTCDGTIRDLVNRLVSIKEENSLLGILLPPPKVKHSFLYPNKVIIILFHVRIDLEWTLLVFVHIIFWSFLGGFNVILGDDCMSDLSQNILCLRK